VVRDSRRLRVAEREIASDENGITIRGTIDFEGSLSLDPASMALAFANTESRPETDASRRDPWNGWKPDGSQLDETHRNHGK